MDAGLSYVLSRRKINILHTRKGVRYEFQRKAIDFTTFGVDDDGRSVGSVRIEFFG
ncbi:hypothetical protein GCM10010913_03900 [Paenibacillus aceti]|uniref:Uncharacterized protein n=1 Tax=Paenibacillus aceti TaxID=1820010 RepID=A0ABQ1VPC4_9BACL|nr:hypothetical protein GCM10010913_03900 [Paenibacillus aceti]